MEELIGESWKLSNGDLIQQLAMLAWVQKGDEGKELFELVTEARVFGEIYNRISTGRNADQLQMDCILGISDFIKKNPRATEKQLTDEVQKHIAIFKDEIEKL